MYVEQVTVVLRKKKRSHLPFTDQQCDKNCVIEWVDGIGMYGVRSSTDLAAIGADGNSIWNSTRLIQVM